MELLLHSIQLDWPVLLPILVCSILTLTVAIDRAAFYNANKRNVIEFIPKLQKELAKNNLMGAQNLAVQCGGIIGEVTEEGVRILSEQKKGFSRSFDIASALATRKLEHRLTILGTIGGVAPFLGLFGTVVRILYTFQDLASQGNQSAAVAMGVAIVAVVCYNTFQSTVRRFEDDFQLIKLLFLSFVDSEEEANVKSQSSVALG